MKPPKIPKVPAASAAPAVPLADVGDTVYFRHPEQGVTWGRVTAHGRDGATCCGISGQTYRVRWSDLLGHRARKQRAVTVIDRGEDGAIVEDESGRRAYLHGELDALEGEGPDADEALEGDEPMAKAAPLLIDIGPLSCGCSDHALEHLHKAMAGEPGDEGIWAPHESPFVRELIEQITQEGMGRLSDLQVALMQWLKDTATGRAAGALAAPALQFVPWAPERAAQVLAYLSSKPRLFWTAADHVLLVDYLVHVHLPSELPDVVAQLATHQAALMGKVQAAAGAITAEAARAILARVADVAELERAMELARIDDRILEYGAARCAETVVAFTDSVRHQLKATILDHEKRVRLQGLPQAEALQTKLLDQFGAMNRDWRRIAVTEAGEMANQGFIAALEPGDKVRRLEQYQGACPFCRKVDGVVATVVSPDKEDKDWDTEIWPGKDNVGRSASPYKRTQFGLVERTEAERWKLPAGLAHPHCRGTWIRVKGPAAQDDEFTRWLDETFKRPVAQERTR